ncbi:MAG: cupin domain-containing protein [Fidelibacterota bacterium]|jgi:quercetin dioxygenase-like cupin family protein
MERIPDNGPIISDLEDMVEFARDGIVSKTILEMEFTKVTLFCMSSGQSLSEHTASLPAIVHILNGEGKFTLGDESHNVKKGKWIFMPANLKHAVKAEEDLVFLLTLFKA